MTVSVTIVPEGMVRVAADVADMPGALTLNITLVGGAGVAVGAMELVRGDPARDVNARYSPPIATIAMARAANVATARDSLDKGPRRGALVSSSIAMNQAPELVRTLKVSLAARSTEWQIPGMKASASGEGILACFENVNGAVGRSSCTCAHA